MGDVVRPDLHAALHELGGVAQKSVRDPDVGLFARDENRVSP
jgi:hypothetical protein